MSAVDLNTARFNMVKQQIQPWEMLDVHVLDAMATVPREHFVDPKYRNLAFAQIEIPIGHDQSTMMPHIEARMLQALALRPTDIVLEVGTGSGFITAILAKLASHVYSVDIYENFVNNARERLAALNLNNVTIEQGDAANGWEKHAPYDVIVITGSLSELPNSFIKSLRPNGRLFAIIGKPPVMEACIITQVDNYGYMREDIFETVVSPLVTVNNQRHFIL